MQRFLQSLIPAFLRKIDHQLLLNKPGIWATRIHYVLFYGGAAMALAWILGFLTKGDLLHIPNVDERFAFLIIPTIAAILFWGYQSHRFQAAQDRSGRPAWREQLISIFAMLVIAAIPVVYSVSLNHHIASQVSDAELEADLESFIIGEAMIKVRPWGEGHSESAFQSKVESLANRFDQLKKPDLKKLKKLLYATHRDDEKLAAAEAYLKVIKKYGQQDTRISAEDILNLHRDTGYAPFESYAGDFFRNVHDLQEAKAWDFYFLFEEAFWHMIFFGLGFLYLTQQYYSVVSNRIFLLAFTLSIALLCLNSIFSGFMAALTKGPGILAVVVLGNWILWIVQAFTQFERKSRIKGWQQMSVYFLMVVTAILPFFIAISGLEAYRGNEGDLLLMMLYAGIGLNVFGWHFFFRKRILELQAAPNK
ncbi:MAG: hypothetical protein AAF206_16225 [Bacteroidota bacterium]